MQKIYVQLLKICQGHWIALSANFEFERVRLSLFSIVQSLLGAENFNLCQVLADATGRNPTLENFQGN